MPANSLMSHIAYQLRTPETAIETAVAKPIRNVKSEKIKILNVSREFLRTLSYHPQASRSTPEISNQQHPLRTPYDNLSSRLTTFLVTTVEFAPEYSTNFRHACKDLRILERISLLPRGEKDDCTQAWLMDQVGEVNFEGLREETRNMYLKVMLETMVGSVQLELRMGVGILREALK